MEYAPDAGETYYLFLEMYVSDVMDTTFLLTVEYATKIHAIHLASGDIVGDIGEEYPLSVTFTPEGIEPENYAFSSADPLVATADVDGNGKADSTDARLVLQYAVKKIDAFPQA